MKKIGITFLRLFFSFFLSTWYIIITYDIISMVSDTVIGRPTVRLSRWLISRGRKPFYFNGRFDETTVLWC